MRCSGGGGGSTAGDRSFVTHTHYVNHQSNTATQLQPVVNSINYTAAALSDEVTSLPGMPPTLLGAFRQFSGYLPISTDKCVRSQCQQGAVAVQMIYS